MSMEKNGAISGDTPQQGCCGGGCDSEKEAALSQRQFDFPEDDEAADAMENDVTKRAIDEVASQASKAS